MPSSIYPALSKGRTSGVSIYTRALKALQELIRGLRECIHTKNTGTENSKMIDSYDFGWIVVDGKRYTTDLIIYSDRVEDGWCRKEGHRLYVEDIEEVVQERPEVLVVGTGYWRLMRVPAETKSHIEERGIELIIQPTKKAWKTYNKLIKSGKEAVAAFHLSC